MHALGLWGKGANPNGRAGIFSTKELALNEREKNFAIIENIA
jgi:hypothetical protein